MVTTEQVKSLRERTGLSVMQCQKALEEAGGDEEKAIAILQVKSGAAADKRSGRELKSGVVSSYIHGAGSVGAIVELSCETDFVAKNEEFKALAYDLAMHVAAADPQFLTMEDIPAEAKAEAEELFQKDIADKPDDLKPKIMEGKLQTYFGEKTLLEQSFIKNPEMKIKDLVSGAAQKFGERTEIRRFVRFSTQG